MAKPLDSSSDTEKMSEDSGDLTKSLESGEDKEMVPDDSIDQTPVASSVDEHISFRYKEMRAQYLQTKKNLEKINAVEDNVSRDVYNTLLTDQKIELDKLEPEVKSLEKDIKKSTLELSNDVNLLSDETGRNERNIEKYNSLYKARIIDKAQRKKEVKALSRRNKELATIKNDKNRELGLLEYAMEDSTPIAPVVKPPESVSSYAVKFLLFTAAMELLVLVFWFIFNGLDSELLGLGNTIPYFHSALQIIIFVGVLFLFTGTRARSVSYFITAGIFFLISILIFTNLQPQNLLVCAPDKVMKSDVEAPKEQEKVPAATDAKQADKQEAYYSVEIKKAICLWDVKKMAGLNFSNYWAAINFTIALFIFVLASVRTFFNGIQYDYRK
jgi:hypothetical protein